MKRRSEAAELRTLEIQRARAERALAHAESNSQLMSVKAPFPGLVVLKQVWKGNTMGEVAEGEEVRPGLPILDIVDSSAMQIRALVNQADIGSMAPGQTAKIRLDAYPDLLLRRKSRARGAAGRRQLVDAESPYIRRARLDPGIESRTDARPERIGRSIAGAASACERAPCLERADVPRLRVPRGVALVGVAAADGGGNGRRRLRRAEARSWA